MLHRAYARLAAMGLRYVASHQSEAITRQRIGQGECYVAAINNTIIATITFKPAEKTQGSAWLERPEVASLAQFAVDPQWQSVGLGARSEERSVGKECVRTGRCGGAPYPETKKKQKQA